MLTHILNNVQTLNIVMKYFHICTPAFRFRHFASSSYAGSEEQHRSVCLRYIRRNGLNRLAREMNSQVPRMMTQETTGEAQNFENSLTSTFG